jgi:hypothetical protein
VGSFLREKELRVALVCFGGASLAVYMHGITKEILKLARASSALHAVTDRGKRASATFLDNHDSADPEYDTEAVYFDLLRDIGRTIELRIIVDIVAGASAGGINSVMLARALSHDLPMGRLRDLWLGKADVTERCTRSEGARLSKCFFGCFLGGGATGLQIIVDLRCDQAVALRGPVGSSRRSTDRRWRPCRDAVVAMARASAASLPLRDRA